MTNMGTTENILQAVDIHRGFNTEEGTINVLTGLSLNINKGEMVSVTGASGVGKSTLLHILGGLDRPDKGEVSIAGANFSYMSEDALATFRSKKVGYVFQYHYLLEDFNALENVMIPMIIEGKDRSESKKQGELLLEQVGLIDRRTHRPHELSGGEQQRVAVARALANEPDILLADEPSGNLDSTTGCKLHDLLLSINATRKTSFLIATHNRELAKSCHRELRLVDGMLAEN